MKKHLSLTGVGPYYVITIVLMTILGIALDKSGVIPRLIFPNLKLIKYIISFALTAVGIIIWLKAFYESKIRECIEKNKLVTSGIYAYVRNPIYTAFMFIAWAIVTVNGNVYLLILCPLYHIIMTISLILTEEKWLRKLYGEDYINYCKKVNRCIPWISKK